MHNTCVFLCIIAERARLFEHERGWKREHQLVPALSCGGRPSAAVMECTEGRMYSRTPEWRLCVYRQDESVCCVTGTVFPRRGISGLFTCWWKLNLVRGLSTCISRAALHTGSLSAPWVTLALKCLHVKIIYFRENEIYILCYYSQGIISVKMSCISERRKSFAQVGLPLDAQHMQG